MTSKEAIRQLRSADIDPGLADLVGSYDFQFEVEQSEHDLDLALSILTQKMACPLTAHDVEQMTGFDAAEQESLKKTTQGNRKKLKSFLSLEKRDGLPRSELIAFKFLEKRFNKFQSLPETLDSAMQLFDDVLSPDEKSLLRKAAAALDLGLFVQLLTSTMNRLRTVHV